MTDQSRFNKLYVLSGALDDTDSDFDFEDKDVKMKKPKAEKKPKVEEEKPKPKAEKVEEKPKPIVEEPYKKMAIPKHVKLLTWNFHVGESIAKIKCMCCESTEISMASFHCGHVIPESSGGPTQVTNLRPICAGCNLSMGSRNMNEFKKTYFGLGT